MAVYLLATVFLSIIVRKKGRKRGKPETLKTIMRVVAAVIGFFARIQGGGLFLSQFQEHSPLAIRQHREALFFGLNRSSMD